MTTYRHLVTIHDGGNITGDPENVRTILTSTDNIQPRERVAVAALPDPLAGALVMLAEYEHGMPRPEWERLAAELRGRTFELRRGVTFTTPADGEGSPVYVENETGSDWSGDRRREVRTGTTLTVYGTVTRGNRVSRGSVTIYNRPRNPDNDGETIRGYWRNLTGCDVPDGARKDVAAAVLALVIELMPPSAWPVLADEADAARKSADIGRHVSEAVRAIEQAQRARAVQP
jgi:hypothetical protein